MARASAIDEGVLRKVRALLAKAESTEFPEEAEALSAKAQELMARHAIDAALIDDAGGGHDEPVLRQILVSQPYASAKSTLLGQVAFANRCRAVWHGRGGAMTLIGFAVDLDVVELLYTSLVLQGTTAMLAEGSMTDAWGQNRTRSFRHSFWLAYGSRVGQRLRDASAEAEAAVAREQARARGGTGDGAGRATSGVPEGAATPGGALVPVLARRRAEVDARMDEAFPRLSSRNVSVSNGEGWRAGVAAANRADLGNRARLRHG